MKSESNLKTVKLNFVPVIPKHRMKTSTETVYPFPIVATLVSIDQVTEIRPYDYLALSKHIRRKHSRTSLQSKLPFLFLVLLDMPALSKYFSSRSIAQCDLIS